MGRSPNSRPGGSQDRVIEGGPVELTQEEVRAMKEGRGEASWFSRGVEKAPDDLTEDEIRAFKEGRASEAEIESQDE